MFERPDPKRNLVASDAGSAGSAVARGSPTEPLGISTLAESAAAAQFEPHFAPGS
jgi:hypothetical protein